MSILVVGSAALDTVETPFGTVEDALLSGNDGNAKRETRRLLEAMGWPGEDVLDLGDITTARGAEMYLIFFLKLWGQTDSPSFNVQVKQAN